MKNHVSLEIAEELKKSGYPQVGLLAHYLNAGEPTGAVVEVDAYKDASVEFKKEKLVVAPVTTEIMDKLMEHVQIKDNQIHIVPTKGKSANPKEVGMINIINISEPESLSGKFTQESKYLPDALAKVWIYLQQEKIL